VWEYGRNVRNTEGVTYGISRGRTTTSRQSVVGVSLGHQDYHSAGRVNPVCVRARACVRVWVSVCVCVRA